MRESLEAKDVRNCLLIAAILVLVVGIVACGGNGSSSVSPAAGVEQPTAAPVATKRGSEATPAAPGATVDAPQGNAPTVEPAATEPASSGETAATGTVTPRVSEPAVTAEELVASLKERLGELGDRGTEDAAGPGAGLSDQARSGPAGPAGAVTLAEAMPQPAGGPGPVPASGGAGGFFPPEAGGQRNPNEAPLPLMYFEGHGVNPFVDADEDALSTFSLDGDTGSFEIARLYLAEGSLPPEDSVRVEEWVNSFDQDYAAEAEGLGIRLDGMMSPFGPEGYRLLRVGVASARPAGERDPVSLIMVLDISGSMGADNRLETAKLVMAGLADLLTVDDRVALVTYGNAGRVAFPMSGGAEVDQLLGRIAELETEGATNLAEGLTVAYRLAGEELEQDRKVRIVVLSDGVGNIGPTGPGTVLELVEARARRDATVTTVGVGISGNYNDVMMEALANRGNGTYHYLRGERQAGEFLLESGESVFRETARDARVQVEFDPAAVRKYRLIGYENRAVADADFRDDALDFGEPGFARDVTALYELRLQDDAADDAVAATVRLRWRVPSSAEVVEVEDSVTVAGISANGSDASPHLIRAAAIAEFAELMRKSYWAQCGTVGTVAELLTGVDLPDDDGSGLDGMLAAADGLFEPYCTS